MAKADKEGQRKAPILRFKGFTDDWEQRKLKELGNIKRGASPRPISDPKWFDENGKYGWLRISDVTSQNGQVFQIDQHLSSIGEEKTVLISSPHLIISIAATVGKPCINYIPTAIHDGFVAFLDYKFNLDFMFEWFNKNQNIWLKYGQPGAQINLNSSIIGNQKIKIPEENEQEKISKLFNILNNLLTLYERKYQLYLLQFQKLQRVIFDNSDDFISLSYLIEIKTGNRNSQDNVKNGKYVFFDRSTEIKRLNEFDFDEEAIIIPGEGTKFAPKYINGKYALHQRSYSLYNFSQEIDSKYLYYFLMTQSNTLLRYSVGTTVPSLRVSTFDHIKVPMYSKELQIKYALTFDSLEKLMNQIKKKTNILRSLKRFLLQVLFL